MHGIVTVNKQLNDAGVKAGAELQSLKDLNVRTTGFYMNTLRSEYPAR